MGISYVRLSKAVSHALRHEPWLYELELDKYGWVLIEDLLCALRGQRSEWKSLGQSDLVQMISTSSKKRHEVNGNRIRALYGHSLPGKLLKKKACPPEMLYHGTSQSVVGHIMADGLLPLGRQYVHLSATIDIAKEVGRRKDKKNNTLVVAAKEAYNHGISFYLGNDAVWLADAIPPDYISKRKRREFIQ